MAFELTPTGCCGVLEIRDISLKANSAAVLAGIKDELINNNYGWRNLKPFILFTSVVPENRSQPDHASCYGGRKDDYGTDLADYIEQNNLGIVERNLEPGKNYTGNMIRVWIWRPDYVALRRYYDNIPTTGLSLT